MSVEVLVIALDLSDASIQRCRGMLSIDERQRADRFRTTELTARFVSSRAALRLVLSNRLGCKPAQIEFLYGLHGKPEIGQPISARGLPFNLSHSGEYAVVAIGDHQSVGVDLEILRRLKSSESLARMVFSAQELTFWNQLSSEQRTVALFGVWTLKEACLKATGEGFSRSMPSFEVADDFRSPADASAITVEFANGVRLEAQRIEALADYELAVAVKKTEKPLEINVLRHCLAELVSR